ncbi:hypothetical protein OGAPHI_000160 [Ogataea philodendri]|uniref:Pre-rRNA-processing protein Ipi1 N-terminal domain-containing protein n=1 Tax=Ogataea philodendri TaxID=1378263 RepID=A0A9P8TAU5_9ASCO|nr:uncharacterized protein OGAPHI_000160 [Ogataea philodendri]KAH3671974.1 hypothetical protein OGAPHI_000160 [Ogataea philodendri]
MGSKRKKTEKQKDFAKKKLKVGKTTVSQNSTSTSFKSKNIHVTSQFTGIDSDIKEINKLLSLLKHHSSNSKHEVLNQLVREIDKQDNLNSFPTDELIVRLKPLILDQSKSVRTATLTLFERLVDRKPDLIILHQSSIILFLLSAMSHISLSIRNDSTKFLNLFLNTGISDLSVALVRRNWPKLLRGLTQLLGWKTAVLERDPQSVSLRVTNNSSSISEGKSAQIRKERKINQLKTLISLITLGVVDSNKSKSSEQDSNAIQVHPLTTIYMIPSVADPFNNIRLYGPSQQTSMGSALHSAKNHHQNSQARGSQTLELDDSCSDDQESCRQFFVDYYLEGIQEGAEDTLKEEDAGFDLKNVTNELIQIINVIKSS